MPSSTMPRGSQFADTAREIVVPAVADNPASLTWPDHRGWLRRTESAPRTIGQYTANPLAGSMMADHHERSGAHGLGQGDHHGALAACDDALSFDPRHAKAWRTRGCAKLAMRDTDGAIADCSEAIRLDPSHARTWGQRARAKLAQGNYDGTIDDCSHSLQLDPGQPDVWYNRAVARLAKRDFEGVISDCTEAIRHEHRQHQYFSTRAEARCYLEDWRGAFEDADVAVHLCANNVLAWVSRGSARSHLGMYEDAIKDADRALVLQPRCVEALNLRAYTKIVQAQDVRIQIEEASGVILRKSDEARDVVHRDDTGVGEKRRVAEAFMLKNVREAIADETQAIFLDRRCAIAWSNRGEAKLIMGDIKGAIADCSEAIQIDPACDRAWLVRGKAGLAKGNYNEAVFDSGTAVNLEPRHKEALPVMEVASEGRDMLKAWRLPILDEFR